MALTLKDLEDIEEKIYNLRAWTSELLKSIEKAKKNIEQKGLYIS